MQAYRNNLQETLFALSHSFREFCLIGCVSEHHGIRKVWQVSFPMTDMNREKGRWHEEARARFGLDPGDLLSPSRLCLLPFTACYSVTVVWIHQWTNPLTVSESSWTDHLGQSQRNPQRYTSLIIPWAFLILCSSIKHHSKALFLFNFKTSNLPATVHSSGCSVAVAFPIKLIDNPKFHLCISSD